MLSRNSGCTASEAGGVGVLLTQQLECEIDALDLTFPPLVLGALPSVETLVVEGDDLAVQDGGRAGQGRVPGLRVRGTPRYARPGPRRRITVPSPGTQTMTRWPHLAEPRGSAFAHQKVGEPGKPIGVI